MGSEKLIGSTLAFSSRKSGSNPGGGEKKLYFVFDLPSQDWSLPSKSIKDYRKWSIHKLIHHVWLSLRLNNLIAGFKTNWTKKSSLVGSKVSFIQKNLFKLTG